MTGGSAPVFIVSTGRAGSKMLARVLARHPKLLALHEPVPHLNTEAYAKWHGDHSRARILAQIASKRSTLIEQIGRNDHLYVESSHYCSHLIGELHTLYRARFIHLHRDGRDFVRSGLGRNWYADHAPAGNRIRDWAQRWIRRRFLLDVGFAWDDHRLEPPKSLRGRLEKVTWLWVEINRVILDGLAELPADRAMSVRLEDFGADLLEAILTFLGVEADMELMERMIAAAQQRPNQTRLHKAPAPADWSETEKRTFDDLAGGMMRKLGYSLDISPG